MGNFKMGKGQNEGGFSQEQLDMYKECFKLMDIDKDGTISKNDIRAAFDNVGKLMTEGEFDVDDDGFLESKAVIGLFVAGGGEEKKEEEKKEEAPPAEAAPAEGAEEGGKKKKKKKKAAK